MFKIHLIVTICLIKLVSSEFSLNNVKLEALKPKGIRVSIPGIKILFTRFILLILTFI